MRVAIVHASDFGGGAERSVVSLHRSLLRSGHRSTLFVGSKRTDQAGVVQIPHVRSVPGVRRAARWAERRFGWQDIYNPSFRNLQKLIPRNTDVVHFNSLWGSGGFADLGILPSLTRVFPTLITLREAWLLTGHCACFFECQRWKTGCGRCPDLERPPAISRDGTRFNWKRKQRIYSRSRFRVITISDWLQDRVRESPLFQGKEIHTVYNGVDCELFSPWTPQQRQRRRSAMGISDQQFVLLAAGQTVEGVRQGISQQWVQAVNELADPGIVPLLIGHSAKQVRRSIHGRAITLPFQIEPADMADCYRIADATVVTSAFEAFGRIAAESQACGTPVIAFDTGALPEVVHDGCSGLVVPRGDLEALKQAIARLVAQPDCRKRMSDYGSRMVRQRFSENVIVADYLSHYNEVALSHAPTVP